MLADKPFGFMPICAWWTVWMMWVSSHHKQFDLHAEVCLFRRLSLPIHSFCLHKKRLSRKEQAAFLPRFENGGLLPQEMNSHIFARKWLEREGLFEKDSDYDGAMGDAVMEVWDFIANQGHTDMSAALLFHCLQAIYQAYATDDHPIWQEYWQSPEGQALIQQFLGTQTT